MKPFWVVLVVAVMVGGALAAYRWMSPRDRIPWRYDLDAARAEAAGNKRVVLAYFTADWCAPCHYVKHTTFVDAGVEAAMHEFVPVYIDVDRQPQLAMNYGITSVPVFAMLDDSGNIARGIAGPINPPLLIKWLGGGSIDDAPRASATSPVMNSLPASE